EETKPVVELSLEVACAMISVCEIGGIDADDSTLTTKDFDEQFEETRFVWKNGKDGRTARRTWVELIQSVCWTARRAHKENTVLPVPEIARANLTSRQRRRLEELRRLREFEETFDELARDGTLSAWLEEGPDEISEEEGSE
ncbi:hypothetical protein B0A53_06489, partial [Rhodotorula sp. CCFEE 5036]